LSDLFYPGCSKLQSQGERREYGLTKKRAACSYLGGEREGKGSAEEAKKESGRGEGSSQPGSWVTETLIAPAFTRSRASVFGIEGDVGEPQAGDVGAHPHAVLVLLEVGITAASFFCALVATVLSRSSPSPLSLRLLQMRHHRARRGAEQAECGLDSDGHLDVAEPQGLPRLIEHRSAPDMHIGLAAEPKKLFFSPWRSPAVRSATGRPEA